MEPVARCSIQPVFTAIDIGIQLAWGCLIKGVVGEFLSSLIERGMYNSRVVLVFSVIDSKSGVVQLGQDPFHGMMFFDSGQAKVKALKLDVEAGVVDA
jgi:hypothetical protein